MTEYLKAVGLAMANLIGERLGQEVVLTRVPGAKDEFFDFRLGHDPFQMGVLNFRGVPFSIRKGLVITAIAGDNNASEEVLSRVEKHLLKYTENNERLDS